MELQQQAAGFYGKLPSNGDFVGRRLARQPFLDLWDHWLQHAIASSREQLQESWLNTYLSSPIWRFILTPGICGESLWAGILMPSVDKVGRYFPLTIAVELQDDVNPLLLADKAGGWFEQAEDVALSALEDDIDLEQFDRSVEKLGLPALLSSSTTALPLINSDLPLYMPLQSAAELAQSCADLVRQYLDLTFSHYSLWWTNGSDQVESCGIIHPGMPSTAGFTAFLDGNWAKWGWPQQTPVHAF